MKVGSSELCATKRTRLVLYLVLLYHLMFVAQSDNVDSKCPVLRATGVSESEKSGCYIVSVNRATNMETFLDIQSRVVERMSEDGKLYGSVHRVTKAFTVKLSDEALETVRSIPEIDFIEEETMVHADELEWHLDRLDQVVLPLDNSYQPIGTGEGVDIYILDTGINYNHEEFEGRAKYSGYDPTDVILSTNQRGADCHGHGTHVASLAGGKTYGSAKKARIYSVRVLYCLGVGLSSLVLEGLDHVSSVISEQRRLAVVSMSLGAPYQQTLNDAVESLISEGIVVVVAAGNYLNIACRYSPASSINAITVGGSSNGDGIYPSSNYGNCVDIFAPGYRVRGADHTCKTCSRTRSGTSYAAPLVSGVVAILLEREPRLTSLDVKNKLISTSVKNSIDFPHNFRLRNTPNRLIYIPGQCGGILSSNNGSFQTPHFPSNYPPNLHCKWTITATSGDDIVQLNFSSFHTEAMHDIVNVCEGWTCSSESNRAQLSGEPTQQNVEYSSVGSVLTVEFISDGRVQFSGFNATYTSSAFTSTAQPSEYLTPMINTTIGNTCPQVTFTCDTRKELGSRVSTIVSSIIQETNSILRYQLSATLYSLASANLLGIVSTYPATNCKEIALTQSLNRDDSGNYWIKSGNGTVIQVYCLFNPLVYPNNGLMRIALLNMSEPESTCPNGLRLIEAPKRSCGRDQNDPGCSSVFFPTHGISYNYICGTVIGYQVGTPNAFFAHVFDPKLAVDDCYVDGISITHGQLPRQHIFTYAAARDEVSPAAHTCPCINTSTTTSSNLTVVPPFVWQNYLCETGSRSSAQDGVFYASDPLWDGLGCGKENSCCDNHDTQRNDSALPFLTFCSRIRRPVTDDVELRICGNEDRGNEDTPIELIELYVTTL